MMTVFTESKTVEQMILCAVINLGNDPSSANWSYESAVQVGSEKLSSVSILRSLTKLIRQKSCSATSIHLKMHRG